MNFKIFSLVILISVFNVSCGVKGDPIAPPGTELKDWYEKYTKEKAKNTPKVIPNEKIQ